MKSQQTMLLTRCFGMTSLWNAFREINEDVNKLHNQILGNDKTCEIFLTLPQQPSISNYKKEVNAKIGKSIEI